MLRSPEKDLINSINRSGLNVNTMEDVQTEICKKDYNFGNHSKYRS
jgi:hypothetical protein